VLDDARESDATRRGDRRAPLDRGAERQPSWAPGNVAGGRRDRDLPEAGAADLVRREHDGVPVPAPRPGYGRARRDSGRRDLLDRTCLDEIAAVPFDDVPVEDLLVRVLFSQEENALAVGRPNRVTGACETWAQDLRLTA